MHEHASATPFDDVEPKSPRVPDVYDKQISASEWYRATALRRNIRTRGSVAPETPSDHDTMLRLERTGFLVRESERGAFRLTDEGHHTLDWAGAPKPTFMSEAQHASEMARAIALHYRVPVHAMLRTGRAGSALVARSRLCAALRARGWSFDRIARHFGMPEAMARAAAERWHEHRQRLAEILSDPTEEG